jgi:hypothetical protein
MARRVFVLCNTEGRSVQYDQMGLGRNEESELFNNELCPCDVVIHECRVRSMISFVLRSNFIPLQ